MKPKQLHRQAMSLVSETFCVGLVPGQRYIPSVEVKEVVLTDGWPAVLVVFIVEADLVVSGFAFVIEAVEEVVIFVDCRVGAAPVACCKSLPCSVIRAGPSWASFFRN